MDLETLRRYCLSFPGASEGLQWGECLLFRVANKIFANVILGEVPPRLWLKCTPERCAEWLELEGISRAPYLGRHDWIELERFAVLRDDELRAAIAESYANVRSKLPRAVQAALDLPPTKTGRRSNSLRKTRAGVKSRR